MTLMTPIQPTQDDATSVSSRFLEDVLRGLSAPRKTLPSKYFYDGEGSRLFEAICELPEYYVTRTETALLADIAPELAGSSPMAPLSWNSAAAPVRRLA
jgi:uncharacterized SAM-dependent methyltransferase